MGLDGKASDLSLLESMLLRLIFFFFAAYEQTLKKIRKPLFIYFHF